MALVIGFFLLLCFTVAVGIFIAFRKGQTQAPVYSSPPQDQYCKAFGHNIHFKQIGQGQDVLLLHGLGASHFVWRFLLPRLSPQFRVTAVDLLGFGESDKPQSFAYDLDSQCDVVLEFMNQLGIQKAFLVGSSMGGTLALRLTQLHPERFPKIAALAPAYDPQIAYIDLTKISFLSPVVRPLITERFIKQLVRRVYSNQDLVSAESIAVFSRPYSNQDAIDSFVKSFRLLRDPRVFNELSNIRAQTLILWGAKDKVIPVKFAKKIQQKIPGAILDIHPTAGHHVHEDEPQWCFDHLQTFLKK